MRITYNPIKNRSNERKHGIPLSFASQIDWHEVIAKVDSRRDYGEVREIGYAIINERLY